MVRLARVVLPGIPHHITQRGVRSIRIFFNKEDRIQYLNLLYTAGILFEIDYLAYCLMDNHVHIVAIPQKEYSFAEAFSSAHRQYTRKINLRFNKKGHFFQGRFFSVPLDSEHTDYAITYVEQNPVRAGICQNACDYIWSSARYNSRLIDSDPLISSPRSTPNTLYSVNKQQVIEAIRKSTHTGRPLGNSAFLEFAEQLSGKKLHFSKRGPK